MFFPIGDSPNQKGFTPWMTWGLMALNIAVYVLITFPLSRRGVQVNDPLLNEYLHAIADRLPAGISLNEVIASTSAYELFTFAHGYKPGAPSLNDLFFCMFLHGGLLHLGGNMLFLWIYGDNVEHHLGRAGFLLTYIATGIMATLFFSFLAGPSMTPLVGASGAISGVLGIYFLLFPRNKIKVFIAFIPFYIDVVLLPSRLVLGIFLVIDNLLPLLVNHQSSVAYGAHIGGFFGGLCIAYAGEQLSWQWPWKDSLRTIGNPEAERRSYNSEEYSPGLSGLRQAMAQGAAERAVDLLSRMDEKDIGGLSPSECVLLSRWLEESGHGVAASRLLRRCLASRRREDNLSEVYLSLGLMRLKENQPASAYQYLLAALEHNPSRETEHLAREALSRISLYRSAV